jgi:hypothetical protein
MAQAMLTAGEIDAAAGYQPTRAGRQPSVRPGRPITPDWTPGECKPARSRPSVAAQPFALPVGERGRSAADRTTQRPAGPGNLTTTPGVGSHRPSAAGTRCRRGNARAHWVDVDIKRLAIRDMRSGIEPDPLGGQQRMPCSGCRRVAWPSGRGARRTRFRTSARRQGDCLCSQHPRAWSGSSSNSPSCYPVRWIRKMIAAIARANCWRSPVRRSRFPIRF